MKGAGVFTSFVGSDVLTSPSLSAGGLPGEDAALGARVVILGVMSRRRHKDLPQHRADRINRLVESSERVWGHRSNREEQGPVRRRLVGVWRHSEDVGRY